MKWRKEKLNFTVNCDTVCYYNIRKTTTGNTPMTRHWLTAAFLAAAFISAVPLRGSDDDAKALLREARNEYKEQNY